MIDFQICLWEIALRIRKPIQVITGLLAIATVSGCSLDREIKELQATVDRNVAALTGAADRVKNAMPGERERDLLWKSVGGTPEEQKAAKSFIATLYQIDVEDFAKYQVTVWATGLSPNESINAQAFLVPYPNADVVAQAIAGRRQTTAQLGSITSTAPTPAQAREAVEKAVSSASTAFFGTVAVTENCGVTINGAGVLPHALNIQSCFTGMTMTPVGTLRYEMPHSPRPGLGGAWEVAQKMNDKRAEGIRQLTAAILPVADGRVNLASSIQLEWAPQGEDNLVVLILDSDYQKIRTRLLKPIDDPTAVRIRAKLHKRGDPAKTFRLQGDRTFVSQDFGVPERVLKDEITKESWRWAFIDVAGTSGLSAQQLQAQAAFQRAYMALRDEVKSQAVKTRK
jgi:hypothetical protein